MKKINSLVLSTLTAALLVGCGGGSSDSSTAGTPTPSTTSVPVTKGPLLEATAVDSSSPVKTGTQIDGTNKYTFTGEIKYPITVTGGYVDVNNNGIVDAGDYEFTGKLSSYSTVVTPITTYLGDTSKPEGEAKLKALKTLAGTNVTNDDLLKKDPTETNKEVLALLNTVYETYDVLMDDDSTNDDVSTIQSTDLSSKFDSYKTAINQSTETDLAKILVVVEEELKNNKAPAKVLSELDAKKINFNKKSVVGKKLVNDKETYFFRENDVVLADKNPEFTRVLSYESSEIGTLKLKFPADYNPTYYDLISITDSGFTVTYYQPSGGDAQSITSTTLEKYIQAELDEAFKDVEFDLTPSMINGKELTIIDSKGTMTAQFKAGGIYSEVFADVGQSEETCTGTWELNKYLKGLVDITSKCSDNETEERFTLVFNEQPKSGSEFKLYSNEETTQEKITTFKNIESSSSDNSSSTQTTPETPTTTTFNSGDTFKGLVYNIITSPKTSKQWLDRNLGASQVCTSSTDTACYGDYYQWGRLADGHEKSTSITTNTQASTISNVGNQFVTVIGDWTTADADGSERSTLWSKTDGTGICPVGFRVPTSEEVTAEEITSSDVAFNNLKFPVAGARFLGTGSLDGGSVWADMWTSSSSTISGKSYYLNFEGNEVNVDFEYRADGRSVRCIKGN